MLKGQSWIATLIMVTRLLSSTAALPRQAEVTTNHAFTGRMCAASRYIESQRPDSLFTDALSRNLAGPSGMRQPMGEWILVPRTRFGDDFLTEYYSRARTPCRQLVLLGAGMDARAYRLKMPELSVFEVDQPTNFDVKEPLIRDMQANSSQSLLTVKERRVVGFDFDSAKAQQEAALWSAGNAVGSGLHSWGRALEAQGFDRTVPTVWLLEGLVYYLHEADVADLFRDIGELSAKGSAVFHDSITASYVAAGIAPGGAPFVSGSDDYGRLWRDNAGFDTSFVRNFDSVWVDRRTRSLDLRRGGEATPAKCKGRNIVLFVTAEKTK